MNRPTTTRTRSTSTSPRPAPRALRRVKDPTGRVDWLAARLLEEYVRKHPDPYLQTAYQELGPTVDQLLARYLGPKNRTLRQLRSYIRQGQEAIRAEAIKSHSHGRAA